MHPVLRFFDWRFLLALTVLILVGSVCWTTVAQARDNEAKSRHIAVLMRNMETDQARSAAQREKLLDGQERLARQYDYLIGRQAVLTRLLREYGVPAELIPPEQSGTQINVQPSDEHTDDADGDTIIVRPNVVTPRPTTRPRTSSSPPRGNDNSDRLELPQIPKVPLPDQAGKATEDAKDIIDGILP